jgi:hypothetical protein
MSADLLSTLFTLFSEKTNCSWLGWRERREKKEGGLPRSRTRCSLATRGTGAIVEGMREGPWKLRETSGEDSQKILGGRAGTVGGPG